MKSEKKSEGPKVRKALLETEHFGAVGKLFTIRLRRAEYLLTRATSQAWSGPALRTGTIAALSQIVHSPGISQRELVDGTSFDKSAINAMVNHLEKLGWAERRSSQSDKRRNALYATDAGEAALAEMIGRIEEIESRMLAQVPPAALAQLSDLLDQLHQSCLTAMDI
jgi:DNA-binding MarR family transcriptional regulator